MIPIVIVIVNVSLMLYIVFVWYIYEVSDIIDVFVVSGIFYILLIDILNIDTTTYIHDTYDILFYNL